MLHDNDYDDHITIIITKITMVMIMMIINMTIKTIMMVRCATGEAWPDIMLAGVGGRPCDPKSYNRLGMTMRMTIVTYVLQIERWVACQNSKYISSIYCSKSTKGELNFLFFAGIQRPAS